MKILIAALTFVWFGLTLGISFVEAPLKFRAPNITTELGLGIGQIVFTALNRIELAIVLLLIIGLISTKQEMKTWIFYALPIVILLIQTVWLLPVLDARIETILAGETPPPSIHHITYIVMETVKLIVLIVAGTHFMKLGLP